MINLLAMAIHPVGFFGQTGLIWALLGFICLVVILAIMFKIVFLALPALGVKEPWISIVYWLCVLVAFIAFINYAFGWGY
jgi:hypothetical protein